jgi:hypothetical protein
MMFDCLIIIIIIVFFISKTDKIQRKITRWYKDFKYKNLNKLSMLLADVWDKKKEAFKIDLDNFDKIDSAYIYDAFPYDFISGEKIVNVSSSFNY